VSSDDSVESIVTQAELADAQRPVAEAAAHHRHAHRQPAISLLGASVLSRLAIVAAAAIVLWVAIAWALA
jgi:hypothetical protein